MQVIKKIIQPTGTKNYYIVHNGKNYIRCFNILDGKKTAWWLFDDSSITNMSIKEQTNLEKIYLRRFKLQRIT